MITIRRATLSDAPGIAAAHVGTWQTTYRGLVPDEYLANLSIVDRQTFWERLLGSLPVTSHVFVAVDAKDQVLGFTSGGPNRDTHHPYDGEVMAIYLLREYQGQGIGRRLFQASIDRLADDGCRSMLVWVMADNPSCHFYAHIGGRSYAERMENIGGKFLKEMAYAWDDLPRLATQKRIYHIVNTVAWLEAQVAGEYRHPSLDTEGFIHCSSREQLVPVANRYFRGQTGLVLFEIDSSKLTAPLRYENTTGGTQLFPHLYGPLNLEALLRIYTIKSEPAGDFTELL